MIGSISLIRIQCGNNFYFVSLDEDKRIQSKKHTNSVQQRVQQSKTSTTAYFTKRGVYAHKTRIAQSLFLEKPVRNQVSERLCICVLGYRFLPLSDLFYWIIELFQQYCTCILFFILFVQVIMLSMTLTSSLILYTRFVWEV